MNAEGANSEKLSLAKNELKRAIRAQDPKKIARAAVKVMMADPASTDTIFCGLRLVPLLKKLLKRQQGHKPLDSRLLRAEIKKELEKVEQKFKLQLSPRHRKIIIVVSIKILKMFGCEKGNLREQETRSGNTK